jgi:hypothetical protein
MQNKAIFYFHFDIIIFENTVGVEKMQLDVQFVLCLAGVECPEWEDMLLDPDTLFRFRANQSSFLPLNAGCVEATNTNFRPNCGLNLMHSRLAC